MSENDDSVIPDPKEDHEVTTDSVSKDADPPDAPQEGPEAESEGNAVQPAVAIENAENVQVDPPDPQS